MSALKFFTHPNTVGTAYAVGKRDFRRYFSNPTGYVFITLFILLSAAAAFWRTRFFLDSLASLDQLNGAFRYLLLFFVPALAMGLWTDERRQGTDELLLTLPATESSLALGKYLAAAGIYAVALAVSVSHAIVLTWLGHPDVGLLVSNYLGFWLIGTALIPAAMLASLVTANGTIAFIVGVLICAVPVGLADLGASVSSGAARQLMPFTVVPYFGDFARGVISLDGVAYFVSLATFFVYIDVAILRRPRWRPAGDGWAPSLHLMVRVVALGVALGSGVVLAGRAHVRFDLTTDRLHSLSEETESLVSAVPASHPVLVQAFISPEVPQPLAETRESLIDVLRELETLGGGKVTVRIEETRPYTEQARVARERFNITPRGVSDPYTGETARDIYLGIAVTSGANEQIIPFFERGLSPEYELARAIRVVSGGTRKRIGVLDTDFKMLGGLDFRTNQPRPEWAAVRELRKQYDVIEVTPASAPNVVLDALVVVQPSRMTQAEMDLAMKPIARGVPTLLLLDPLPTTDIRFAPAAELASQLDPYQPVSTSRIVYGDIRQALNVFGLNWVPAQVVWDGFNPHPDLANMPRETVFVGQGNGNPAAFNRNYAPTAALHEVLLLYRVSPTDGSTPRRS